MKPLGATKPTRDFGGMWGMGSNIPGYNYINPVTGAASCPAGYTARIGWGTDNLDWLFHWCYKPDATATTTTTTSTGILDSAAAQSNFDTVNTKLAPYLNAPGNVNIAAGEFGTAATELQMTQDTRLDSATSFTKDEAWARVKTLLSIPNSASVLWSQTSTQYGNLGSVRFVYSYVIQDAPNPRQILFATEFLPSYGWRKVYLIGKNFPLPALVAAGPVQVGACCPAGSQWSSVQNKCATPLPPVV